MRSHYQRLDITTSGRGTYEITERIQREVQQAKIKQGICVVFIQHTSASLLLTENADPAVRRDLEKFLADLAPDGDRRFSHTAEGPDDMPAHIRAVLCESSLTIPVQHSKLDIGTWQGIFLYEHRHAEHQRVVSVTILGE